MAGGRVTVGTPTADGRDGTGGGDEEKLKMMTSMLETVEVGDDGRLDGHDLKYYKHHQLKVAFRRHALVSTKDVEELLPQGPCSEYQAEGRGGTDYRRMWLADERSCSQLVEDRPISDSLSGRLGRVHVSKSIQNGPISDSLGV